MVVPMDDSDADAVRHLLTATQRFAARAEEARRRQEDLEREGRPRDGDRYRYRFDDFENFDEDSDDERDFRDLSHYTTIDPTTGKVTELWLGIIDVYGSASLNSDGNDKKHWRLSESDWKWLSQLDRLEHLKLTGCGGLPHRQLKELRFLKHISCSECGNVAGNIDSGSDANAEGNIDVELPQVKSISLRCGFQPNPAGIESLRAMFRYIYRNLTNLERINIWRLDQQQWRGQITNTTALQRKEYRRVLVETLLEELSGGSLCNEMKTKKKVKTIELNRCGLTSVDFRKLMFEILPKNFPSLQRLSVSSNEIDELPEIQKSQWESSNELITNQNNKLDKPNFLKKKRLFRRLRKNLQQIHLSNNPIMEFLGKSGDEHRQLPRVEDDAEQDDNQGDQSQEEERRHYQDGQRRQEEENAIVLRRSQRIKELEKLRDWLRLLPKLSQLGYVACVQNLMRSITEDFVVTTARNGHNDDSSSSRDLSETVIPFFRYSNNLQQQIEYYLRVNRGGRWLIDGGFNENGKEDVGCDNRSCGDLANSLSLWPNILEWSYRTSSSGCFLVKINRAPCGAQTRQQEQSAVYNQYHLGSTSSSCSSSSRENATALYHLLRDGPVWYGEQQ